MKNLVFKIVSILLTLLSVVLLFIPFLNYKVDSSSFVSSDISVDIFTFFSDYSINSSGISASYSLITFALPTLIVLIPVFLSAKSKTLRTVFLSLAAVLAIFFMIVLNRFNKSLEDASSTLDISTAGIVFSIVILVLDIISYLVYNSYDMLFALIQKVAKKETKSLEDKLQEINLLKEKGLISVDEYDKMRSDIINENSK